MDTPMKSVEQSQEETRQQEMEVKKQLAKIYRLFSSKKYMKYKHQFPRMKETEIVNKIIKEWESMTKEEKLKLKESYTKKEMLDSQSEESDFSANLGKRSKNQNLKESNDKKETPENKIQLENKKIEIQKPTKIKVNETSKIQRSQQSIDVTLKKAKQQKEQIPFEDLIFKSQESEEEQQQEAQSQLKNKQEEQNSQSVLPSNKNKKNIKVPNKNKQLKTIKDKKKIIKKEKPIKKQSIKKEINYSKLKNGQYLLFYKYYYKKLKNQHPKWSQTQITFIVKLLWKKHSQKQKLNKQLSNKQSKIQSSHPSKPRRPISGKQYFTNQKLKLNLTRQQINQLWKHLPRESKNDWNKRALRLSTQNVSKIKQDSNVKSETTAKIQNRQKKQKTIVTFRDLLLKGRVTKPANQHIIEQKKEGSFPEPIPQQKFMKQNLMQNRQQNQNDKFQDVHYVSLQANPFSFMMKKIDNKILLQ